MQEIRLRKSLMCLSCNCASVNIYYTWYTNGIYVIRAYTYKCRIWVRLCGYVFVSYIRACSRVCTCVCVCVCVYVRAARARVCVCVIISLRVYTGSSNIFIQSPAGRCVPVARRQETGGGKRIASTTTAGWTTTTRPRL